MNNFIAHILVVDDDDRIRNLVKDFLSQNKYLISTSANAEDAQKKINLIEFDHCIGYNDAWNEWVRVYFFK